MLVSSVVFLIDLLFARSPRAAHTYFLPRENPMIEPIVEPVIVVSIAMCGFSPAKIAVVRIAIGEINWGTSSRRRDKKRRAGNP